MPANAAGHLHWQPSIRRSNNPGRLVTIRDLQRSLLLTVTKPKYPIPAPGRLDKFLLRWFKQLLGDIQAGNIRPCTQFSRVLALYEARNKIVHDGKLGLSPDQENRATWFIAARLLHRVLTWFAQRRGSDLAELDAEIAGLPTDAAATSPG